MSESEKAKKSGSSKKAIRSRIANVVQDNFRAVGLVTSCMIAGSFLYSRMKDPVGEVTHNLSDKAMLLGLLILGASQLGRLEDHIFDREKTTRRTRNIAGTMLLFAGLAGSYAQDDTQPNSLSAQPDITMLQPADNTILVYDQVVHTGENNVISGPDGGEIIFFSVPSGQVPCTAVLPRQLTSGESPWSVVAGALVSPTNNGNPDDAHYQAEQNMIAVNQQYPDLLQIGGGGFTAGQTVAVGCPGL